MGYCQAKGIGRFAPNAGGIAPADFEEMRRETDALKAKYPDGPKQRKKKHKPGAG